LDPKSRTITYKGFVRPLLEYGMLVWMGAAPSALASLTAVQRRALHIIGPGSYLPSLALRRTVGALCYLYKLHYACFPQCVQDMKPPAAAAPARATRHSAQVAARHNQQLALDLPPQSRNNVLRAFPSGITNAWNALPVQLLQAPPSAKGMQSFKRNAHRHLQQTDWSWAHDSL
jgi:hypothetical protein